MQVSPPLYLSVVIPVYGSELVLPKLTAELDAVMRAQNWTYEVIYVCDRSPDQSWKVIQDLSRQFASVRGILLRTNVGQHNALIAGLTRAQGRMIVTMDDDLQHNPLDIPLLIAELEAGYDLVYTKFRKRRHPLWKVIGSKVNDLAARVLIKKPADLYLSPFRAFRSELRDEIVKYSGPFTYVDGLLLSATKDIASVEVDHHDRHAGVSYYGLRKSLSLWMKMATSFSAAPLRITSVVGSVIACLGFLLALFFIVERLAFHEFPSGWASIIVTLLILGGFQLIAIGIVGEYLGRVLITMNGRPQYIIKAIEGFDDSSEKPAASL